MRALFRLVLIAVSLAPAFARAQVEVNPDIEQFRSSLEAKLLHAVETFVGPRSKVLASVRVTATPLSKILEEQAETDAKKATDETWLDLGYVTTPNEGVSPETKTTVVSPGGFRVDSVDADVRVSEKLDDATLAQVQTLAQNTLSAFSAKVKVAKTNFLEAIPEPPKAETAKEELSGFEKFLAKYGALVPLLGAILIGLGLIVASGTAVRSMGQAAADLASGLRSLKAAPAPAPNATAANAADTKESDASGPKAPPVPPRLRDHFRNLTLVKKRLSENPLPFLRALAEEGDDRRGLKWLLTNLNDEERAVIRKIIGLDRLSALAQDPPAADDVPWDPTAWLQTKVEDLVLREIAGGSLLEKAIDADQTLRLSSASAERLYKAAEDSQDPLAWRVAIEFLPRERVATLLRDSKQDFWKRLVEGSEIDADAARRGAAMLIERLGDDTNAGAAAAGSSKAEVVEERRRFYSNILLDPAVDSVLAKGLGDDDTFLEELSGIAPDFVTLLRTKVWTPRSLERVPDEALREAFLALTPAQKTAVLLALPEGPSERLQSYFPEGTGRTIVLDQLRKARERGDAAEAESATRLAREFLDYLRKQVGEGRFNLIAEANDNPEEAPSEAA